MAHMNMTIKNSKPIDRINLRLSPDVFVLIDQARATRLGNMSRNTWIAEAIQEKLAREIGIGSARTKAVQGGN
jgi:uncharacterized protein (DUF1778 family)